MEYTPTIGRIIEQLKRLPGIGTKSAERITDYLLGMDKTALEGFAEDLKSLKSKIRLCRNCFNVTEEETCSICRDQGREKILAVVEEVRDVAAFEKTVFRGYYHVLGGRLNPLAGVGPDRLHIVPLLERLKREQFSEILIATNATPEGETTAAFLAKLLAENGFSASRLACGMPVGSELEYLDSETLKKSIENRRRA